MGGDQRDRLRWKEPLHSLKIELQNDFGLSPVSSKALVRRIEELLDTYLASDRTARSPGQICYTAVSIGERAGKPIRWCMTRPVNLTIVHASDVEVLHDDGKPALRRVRLARLCDEAYGQGAVLSHEDLSLLLAVDMSTVRRLVGACARQGARPPTRGVLEDIGPAVSHKHKVVELFYRGLPPAHIGARIGHSLGSVERYLADFARVVHLHHKGLVPEVIVRITGLSPKTVKTYLGLGREYAGPRHRPVTQKLLLRFGPLEDDGSREAGHG